MRGLLGDGSHADGLALELLQRAILDGLCALDSEGGLRCCGFFFGSVKVGVGRAGVSCDPALLNARPSTPSPSKSP